MKMNMFDFFKEPKINGRVSILIPTMFDSRYIIELCLKSIWKKELSIIILQIKIRNKVKGDYLWLN